MSNSASILRDEVLRLARKEVRKEVVSLRKASAQHRSDIAALKRQIAFLVKQQGRIEKKNPSKVETESGNDGASRFRFSAKRLAAQRAKQGLSAAEMGALIGVSAQTIYHWEAGKTRPRQSQLTAIAATRRLGKRQIKAALEALKG